jgi:hypothetical protein
MEDPTTAPACCSSMHREQLMPWSRTFFFPNHLSIGSTRFLVAEQGADVSFN